MKPLGAFHRNARRRDGVHSQCRTCRALADHQRYEARVGRAVPREPQRSERGRTAWLVSLKAGRPCTDCGRIYPHQVMQWDHRPGLEKLGDVSEAFWGRSRDEVLAEIAKCDLVCANCHAIRTFSRNGWGSWWARDGYLPYDAIWSSHRAA